MSWFGFLGHEQDSGRTATFIPSPQTQGKAVGWNKRSGSTKRSREEHQSFQPVLLFTQPKSDSYCSSDPYLYAYFLGGIIGLAASALPPEYEK